MTCDDVLTALVLRVDDPDAGAHLATCAACAADAAAAASVGRALAAYTVGGPAPGGGERTLRAAAPALAANAAHARRRRVTIVRAIAASLVPLPILVVVNVEVLRAVHAWLTTLLPSALGTYLIGSWTAFLVVLFALTYAAVPLLAGHQASHGFEEAHA